MWEVRFFGGVIDAYQHLVFLKAESRDFRERDELIGGLAADDIHHFLPRQNVFGQSAPDSTLLAPDMAAMNPCCAPCNPSCACG